REARLEMDVPGDELGGIGAAVARILPGELNRREPRPQEVGFQGDDHPGAVEAVVGYERRSVRSLVGATERCERSRLVDDVLERGEGIAPTAAAVGRRWRG